MVLPKKLTKRLDERNAKNALRTLKTQNDLVDFASNDYLGFAMSSSIFDQAHQILTQNTLHHNGATGSRLLTGNHKLYIETESFLARYHNAESALIFNSGYDANIGFFSSVPQRGDMIFFDELIHASIRDGIQMSHAKSYKFKHNDLEDLSKKFEQLTSKNEEHQHSGDVYVVTESVFSMDGDSPDLKEFVNLSKTYGFFLIVDEAHATGVFGANGVGLLQQLEVEQEVFARIITFGKAMGCHGAAVLGSKILQRYLVNFARSFIYTTGLPVHAIATIQAAYGELQRTDETKKLMENIRYFRQKLKDYQIASLCIDSNSAIQCCIISGNEKVKKIAQGLQKKGFDVKPIMSPTVPLGKERLRFCLHSYNSKEEIDEVLKLLATFV
nr:pyridoxal phosphate-dependent aminotransferase family protein [Aquimarina spongiae]